MSKIRKFWVSREELLDMLAGGRFPLMTVDAGNVGGLTPGSIPFAGATGFLTQDNANLFWDAANLRLGIGTAAPEVAFDLEFDAVATVVSRVSAQTRPWRHWECVSGNWGLAIGIDANDGIIHFNYDAPIGTMNTIMMVFDGPNVRVGILDSTPAYPLDVGGNTNIQGTFRVTGAATLLGALAVTGLLSNTGGAKLEIQGGVDGGSTRGIFMWDTSSTSWGIYVSESGAGKSLADGVACTNFAGDTGHHIRFRISDTAGRAFVWENSSEVCLMDLEGDTGNLTILGNFSLRSSKELHFYDNGNYVGFKAPALGADFIWSLPATDGPANEALATDSGGNLIWRTHDELAGYVAKEHRAWEDSIAQDIHDDNISESSVTQHVGAIDHDALLNYAADQHLVALDEDDMASDSDTNVATQQSIKAYVDTQVATINEFIELTDTPAAYAGHGNETLRVNFAEDAIEFYVQTDQYVKVDGAAAAGYLGVAAGDGVLRTGANITVADGGNFITLDTVQDIGTGDSPTFAGLTITDYIFFDKDVEHVALFGFECGKNLAGGGTYHFFAGEQAGFSATTSDFNIAIGYQALYRATTGGQNIAIGYQALLGLNATATTYAQNVGIGFEAGEWIKAGATGNFLLGTHAGRNIQTASYCVFIGTGAGYYQRGNNSIGIGIGALGGVGDSTAGDNVGIGTYAGKDTVTGAAYNVSIGSYAGYFTEAGDYNICIGYQAGQGVDGSSHSRDILLGAYAGKAISTANDCVIIGYVAGTAVTTGGDHVLIGESAGKSITTETGCVMLGHAAGENATASNVLYIANSNTVTPLIYGEFDTPLLKVTGEFDVVGPSKLGDGGTTNYAETKADGEINLHGTARVIKQIYLNNAAFTKGGTAPTQVILGNLNGWEFDIGDDAVVTVMLPPDWAAGTDITIKVCWYIDEAYAADKEIQWRIDWSALPHDFSETVDAPTHSGQIDSGDIDIPAVAKRMGASTIGTIAAANLSANDMLGFTLSRIAVTNDDPTADPAIHHLIIEYIADKLGTAT